MKHFKDKVIVVTGAASGMGRAYAMEFGRLGARLALNDWDEHGLRETSKALKSKGYNEALLKAFDVSDRAAMYDFAADVKSRMGNAHIIINNAGIEGGVQSVFHTDEAAFRRVMNVNYFGVLYGCKAFLPQLIENGEGAVVNVSSVFGLIGTPNHGDYCASKFAVRGLTEAMMVEFQDSPISIHSVHPGGINTNIMKKDAGKKFADKFLTTSPEKLVRRVIRAIRSGQPKIVYGNQSWYTWFGSNFIPQRLLNKMIWWELRNVVDTSRYEEFARR